MNTFRSQAALLLFLIIIAKGTFAQLNTGGIPRGLGLEAATISGNLEIYTLGPINTKALSQEDLFMDTIADIPFRFGENIFANLNPENSGKWQYLENGDKLWHLAVSSPGAISINLAFDKYYLPDGAKLYVYTPGGEYILGAFTHLNNQDDGFFATTLLPGDQVIIEYFEPANVPYNGKLNLWRITHGYRGPGEYLLKAFRNSGACNINVECEVAVGWEDQIRSVGMVVTGGNGFCTGALINNTLRNGKPLFLTANHCYTSPSTLVFWFNWQSAACANPASIPPHNAMSGAVNRARNTTSDFWLLELNQPIPQDYGVFFSGWNRTLEPVLPGRIATIHHPRGDIKKFSFTDNSLQAASYLGNVGSGNTHWRIPSWNGGTTEPGSSGSPLFDASGRIIGQLHGGYAACGNQQPDWYGRLGISWTGAGTNNTRLSNWLDPTGSEILAIDGYDPVRDATNDGAPAAISGLKLTPGFEGLLTATLEWKNPVFTHNGEPLEKIDSIVVFRNGIIISSLKGVTPGENSTYIDEGIMSAGLYNYTLVAINNSGDGPPVSDTSWIGQDIPDRVSNIVLVDEGNTGLLTWQAPTTGLNGGFFNPSSITHYLITRFPDQTSFQVPGTTNQFTDETLPGVGFYYYTIVAVNNTGNGASALSETVLLAADGAIFMFSGNVVTFQGVLFDSGGPNGNYLNNENLLLKLLPETDGAKVMLQFTEFNTEPSYDLLSVYHGSDTDESNLAGIFSGAGVPDALKEIISTHPSGALTLRFKSDNSVNRPGWKAMISCFIPTDNDLAALSLTGPATPTARSESLYTIKVGNTGFLSQSDYSVSLITTKGEILASVAGVPIEPGEIIEFAISWTPPGYLVGNISISGLVELEEDGNLGNNTSKPVNINVLPAGMEILEIGTSPDIPDYRMPFDFYWRNSLLQTIFFEDEMQGKKGKITGISFRNQFSRQVTNREVKIYLQHTDSTSLSRGFIPVVAQELVFEGNVDFPAGENIIYIPFTREFNYNGGNILLTTHRVIEPTYFSVNEKFFVASTPSRPSRSVQFNSDQVNINPGSPPTTGAIIYRSTMPVASFYLFNTPPPEPVEITFNIDMSQVPKLQFDPLLDKVYITGSFFSWAEPGTILPAQLMLPTNENQSIYSVVLNLLPGTYEYKYFINQGFDGAEWQDKPHRELMVTENAEINDIFANGSNPLAQVRFVHNASSSWNETFDIFFNGKKLPEKISYRNILTETEVPAGREYSIQAGLSSTKTTQSPLFISKYTFKPDSTYFIILNGTTKGTGFFPVRPPQMAFVSYTTPEKNKTGIQFYHGNTDLNEISFRNRETGQIIANIPYNEFSGSFTFEPENLEIELRTSLGGDTPAVFELLLQKWETAGNYILVVSSGFQNPSINSSGPNNSLWAALPDSTHLIPLENISRIDDLGKSFDVRVYPNPVHDVIHISSDKEIIEIQLLDPTGRIIQKKFLSENRFTLKLPTLNPGVYLLYIRIPGGAFTKKVVKY